MANWKDFQLNTEYRNEMLRRAANEELAQLAQADPETLYGRVRRRFVWLTE